MIRILIVSNDDAERAVLRSLVESAGAQALEAATFPGAAEALARGGADAVVADHALDAGKTGLDLLGERRAAGDGVPFVLAVALPDVDVGLERAGEPGLGILLKPADGDRLAAALRRAGVAFGAPARSMLCCACGAVWTVEQVRTASGRCAKCGDARGAVLVAVGAAGDRPGDPPSFPDGRYVLTHLLGRTHFSEVWAGWQPTLRRRVVLKFARPGEADDVARFRREARLHATLRHEGIPAVYEAVLDPPDGGRMYLAIEHVDGVPLDDAVRALTPASEAGAIPPKPLRAILDLVRQAALALDHLHSKKLVHRDVKPENVLASPDGRAWLIDYGLARPQDPSTAVTSNMQVLGTLPFMAPELVKPGKDPLDGRADVWSLGAMLYYLLTWRYPFLGSSIKEVATAILKADPPRPRDADPRIPAGVEAIVLRALAKRREDRWPTAGAMARALEEECRLL
ncbi:MAG: protein kinase [Planctomycetes bacterium]|nr:protein kinase [Planctomycetota bacterium]